MEVNIFNLEDIANIDYGTRVVKSKDEGNEYPVYGGGGKTFRINKFNRESCVVISRFAMSPKCTRYINEKIFLNDSGLTVSTKDSSKILQEYLNWYILSRNDEIYSFGRGVGQRNLEISSFKRMLISYPTSLEEQKKIANILDKVTSLISLRKEQLKKLDELIKSRFIEMFGDPVKDKSIPKEYLEKYLVYVQNGISIRRKIPQNIGEIVFRIKEIRENYIDYTNVNRIPLDDKEKEKYRVNTNELLFIRVNGNKDYVGRNAVFKGYNEDTFFNDHIMRVKVKESELNHIYLSRFLNLPFGKEEIRKYVKTSAGQFTINQQGLGSIELPIPPIEEQNKFASFVEEVEKNKEKVNNSLNKLETLKNALMQKYFEDNI